MNCILILWDAWVHPKHKKTGYASNLSPLSVVTIIIIIIILLLTYYCISAGHVPPKRLSTAWPLRLAERRQVVQASVKEVILALYCLYWFTDPYNHIHCMLRPVACNVGFISQRARCRGAISCREAAIASKFKTCIISLSVILTDGREASLYELKIIRSAYHFHVISQILLILVD
jgi:hypothetical protein